MPCAHFQKRCGTTSACSMFLAVSPVLVSCTTPTIGLLVDVSKDFATVSMNLRGDKKFHDCVFDVRILYCILQYRTVFYHGSQLREIYRVIVVLEEFEYILRAGLFRPISVSCSRPPSLSSAVYIPPIYVSPLSASLDYSCKVWVRLPAPTGEWCCSPGD